jgi:hypothetical protein
VSTAGPLALAVEVDERSSLGLRAPRRLDPNTHALELSLRPVAERIVTEGGEEQAPARKLDDLHRGDRSPARGLLPGIERLDDPGAGTRSTRANSPHSTWPTTASVIEAAIGSERHLDDFVSHTERNASSNPGRQAYC